MVGVAQDKILSPMKTTLLIMLLTAGSAFAAPPTTSSLTPKASQESAGWRSQLSRELPKHGVAPPSWYVWKALARLDGNTSQRFWRSLPPTSRILVSLNAKEIAELGKKGQAHERLSKLLSSAKARQVKVELLLGDAEWVLPGQGEALLKTVHKLSAYNWDGIHLDIEQSQLPEGQKAQWQPGLIALVTRLRETTDLPLGLSIHPRDANEPALLADLKKAGLNEVTFMAYITNPDKVAELVAPVMQRYPELKFSVAQSIEDELDKSESYFHAAPEKVAQSWAKLASRLSKEPNYAGLLIQSLDKFLDRKPL